MLSSSIAYTPFFQAALSGRTSQGQGDNLGLGWEGRNTTPGPRGCPSPFRAGSTYVFRDEVGIASFFKETEKLISIFASIRANSPVTAAHGPQVSAAVPFHSHNCLFGLQDPPEHGHVRSLPAALPRRRPWLWAGAVSVTSSGPGPALLLTEHARRCGSSPSG